MSNYTILLIDYEPKSIDRVRRPLAAIGYKVEVATDGISGLEAFNRIKPDLVIVEAMIPRKHGFEVCQELKKSPAGKQTPVVITTSVYKGRKYRSQAFHLHGCDEYIEKPVDEEKVVEICRKLLKDERDLSAAAPPPAPPPPRPAAAKAAARPEPARSVPPPPPPPRSVPVAAAPSFTMDGLEDDELEILAKLDAILPGEGGRSAAATRSAVAPRPSVAAATASHPPMEMARSASVTEESPAIDAPPPAPAVAEPLVAAAGAIADDAIEIVDEETTEPPQVDAASSPPETAPIGARRSRKKDRRKKGGTESIRAEASSVTEAVEAAADAGFAAEPSPDPFGAIEPASVPVFSERDAAPFMSEPAPRAAEFDASGLVEPKRSLWWVWLAFALLFIGAAGAFIYIYLGGLMGASTSTAPRRPPTAIGQRETPRSTASPATRASSRPAAAAFTPDSRAR